MPNTGNGQGLISIGDLRKPREVCTRGYDEWLASDRDGHDVISGQRGVQSAVQLCAPPAAKGIGPSVITPVVECDQHRGIRGVWQPDVSAPRPCDDLTRTAGRGG